jgi:uncharacterized protein (TIGR02996 family)
MPTDEQRALWAAIRANPDDDTPRLVYADWLQEHGDEARAEFIRVQCALAKLGTDRRTGRKQRPTLEKQEKLLLARHRNDWLTPMASAISGVISTVPRLHLSKWLRASRFQRGFAVFDGLHISTTEFLALSAIVEPVQSIRIRTERYERNHPVIEVLTQQDASNCVIEIIIAGAADEDVTAIARSKNLRLLGRLCLIHGSVSDAGVRELVAWRCAARLRELGLTNNPITDAGATAIAESPNLTNLAFLNMTRTQVTRDGLRTLRNRFGTRCLLDLEL